MRALAPLSCVLLLACVDDPPEAVPMVGGVSACPGVGDGEVASGEMITVVDGVAYEPWRGLARVEERDDGRYEVATLGCVLDPDGVLLATWDIVWFLPDLIASPLQVAGVADPDVNGFSGTYGRRVGEDLDTFGLGGRSRGQATVRAFDPAGLFEVTMEVRGVPTADAEGGEVGELEAALRWTW